MLRRFSFLVRPFAGVAALSRLLVVVLLAAAGAVLAAPQPASAAVSLDEFVASSQGREWANVAGTYSGECVSLVSQYLYKVYDIRTGAWGNAVDYRAGGSGGNQLASRGFSWSTDTAFQDGDILVWGDGSSTGAEGHIAIWYHGQLFDQNWSGRRYAGFHGFFSSAYLGHWRKAGGGGGPSNGSFVSYGGAVYRVAGGAPIYVSSWGPWGGPQPTTALSDAQFASLRATPVDGTFLVGQSTGRVFITAGGAPEYVGSWDIYGGPQPTVAVDDFSIDNAGGAGILSHLNAYPVSGTFVSAHPSGRVYRIAGGAPLYVASWAGVGGQQPTVPIRDSVIDQAGINDVTWSHMRATPTDIFLRGFSSGRVFRVVSGGHAYYVNSWDPYGGVQPYLDVDDWAIDNCDHLNCSPWGDLNSAAGGAGTITVRGWAQDPDTTEPILIHAYVDGAYVGQGTANQSRPDVDAAFHRGPNFGFEFPVGAAQGTHEVCVYGINLGLGGNQQIECSQVSVGQPATVSNTSSPAVSGTAKVGTQLTASSGTWTPSGTAAAYQWLLDGSPISGATTSSYSPVAGDLGKTVSVKVTASKAGYASASATSAGVVVQPGAISNTALPTVSGNATVGGTLNATAGSWMPSGTLQAYQWLLDGSPIGGATSSSYSPVAGDVGKTVSVRVTASKAGYTSISATSSGVLVAAQDVPPMTATSLPTISGTPRVGVKLTASPGTWSPSGTYAYQWLANGSPISGVTASTYTPTAGVKGMRISVRVTATKSGYSTGRATSAQTGVVAAGSITNSAIPYIKGTTRVGYTLTAYVGTWSPSGLTYRYQWFKGTTAISGATGRTYKLPAGVRGKKIRVRVTAVRTGYTSLAKYSASTVAIK